MKLKVPETGLRIDVFLTSYLNKSRNFVQKLIKDGRIRVNEVAVKVSCILEKNDEITLDLNDEITEEKVVSEQGCLDVLWQDKDVAVINKPAGLVVHLGAGNDKGTLVNILKYYYAEGLSDLGGADRLGIVHRLDKDTEGVMVVAKNNFAHAKLVEEFKKREVEKRYYAVVYGNIKEDDFVIDLPLARAVRDRKKMRVVLDEDVKSRKAVSEVRVLKRYNTKTLIEINLKTGRTHQIRVHLAYLGFPLVGDKTYGGKKVKRKGGQLLQSYFLAFMHPRTGERLVFKRPLSGRLASV
ncbi:RluA family pseudouridine synthase [bacterium]|jgi:23S rRNA pseudouridine1911/1915/1917 synthase|nr:RluA family pseudouridine synthase [bacterium]MBT3581191.1 RluA family pseudouridine synthase [bacterium]MBT4551908.1 RluA family pseudouridine synthase [bacterium]